MDPETNTGGDWYPIQRVVSIGVEVTFLIDLIMKNKTYIFKTVLFSIVLLFLISCAKVLDRVPDNQITEEIAFASWDKVNGMANNLYRDMRDRDKGNCNTSGFFHVRNYRRMQGNQSRDSHSRPV